jgi:penicillin G amidase
MGSSIVGIPGILIGKNEFISWGVTNIGGDIQDLFIIKESQDGNGYIKNDGVKSYIVREEMINIKDSDPYKLVIKETEYGPIINDAFNIKGDEKLAFYWLCNDKKIFDTTVDTLNGFLVAKDFNEFRNFLKNFIAPSLNIVYSDVNGNIGYQSTGIFPIRRVGHTGMYLFLIILGFLWPEMGTGIIWGTQSLMICLISIIQKEGTSKQAIKELLQEDMSCFLHMIGSRNLIL